MNRCWVGKPDEHCVEGEIIGLLKDETTGDVSVVVRFQGHGMYVRALHPSKVQLTDPRKVSA